MEHVLGFAIVHVIVAVFALGVIGSYAAGRRSK